MNQQPSTLNRAAGAAHDICVLGLGYIGLPTASIFATKGKRVLGVDVVPRVVETISRGNIHIEEPDLDVLVRAGVQSGNLRAALAPEPAAVFILAVPTPFKHTGENPRAPDLSYVEAATRSLAAVVEPGNLIILESTSPVGTTERVRDWLHDELGRVGRIGSQLSAHGSQVTGHSSQFTDQGSQVTDHSSQITDQGSQEGTTQMGEGGRRKPEAGGQPNEQATINDEQRRAAEAPLPLLFAHCPERILPGQMLKELVANDRIVGGLTPEASVAARDLYRTFCSGEIFLTDARTAEMCKLTENASRDVGIAFANELSLICERLGIDVWELIRLANRHPRVKILQPGPGVGGHCIAVDPWFVVDAAPDLARLIRTAREVNDAKPHHVVAQIKAHAGRLKAPVIACLGLAFKADVDDLRESPAVEIVAEVAREQLGRLLVVEPHIEKLPPGLVADGAIELVSLERALDQADIVVLLVNHRQFAGVDRARLKDKTVIDTRGLWR